MRIAAKVEINHVLPCPACDKGKWNYGHLPLGTRFGPWFCVGGGAMTYKQLYDGIESALSRPAKTLAIYHKLASTTDASLYAVVSGCNALHRADRIRPTAETADMQPNEIVWERVPEVVA